MEVDQQPLESAPFPRPTSSWTFDSGFTDSAISVGENTSTASKLRDETLTTPLSTTKPPVSDRLTQLAAAAWAAEQDGCIGKSKKRRLESFLDSIEAMIEDDNLSGVEDEDHTGDRVDTARLAQDEEGVAPSTAELGDVHNALAATVASMRLRQQEQRHLHQLAVHKLEAVAQECLVQQNQLELSNQEVRHLRTENQIIGEENDQLRNRVTELEHEASKREVAVNAMSSAVSGLEGYIESAESPSPVRLHPNIPKRNQKAVFRGKGRFRGKYYVDDMSVSSPGYGFDGTADTKELQDGVKAWLRGFRDVEEELRIAGSERLRSKEVTVDSVDSNEDWGEFETVPAE